MSIAALWTTFAALPWVRRVGAWIAAAGAVLAGAVVVVIVKRRMAFERLSR